MEWIEFWIGDQKSDKVSWDNIANIAMRQYSEFCKPKTVLQLGQPETIPVGSLEDIPWCQMWCFLQFASSWAWCWWSDIAWKQCPKQDLSTSADGTTPIVQVWESNSSLTSQKVFEVVHEQCALPPPWVAIYRVFTGSSWYYIVSVTNQYCVHPGLPFHLSKYLVVFSTWWSPFFVKQSRQHLAEWNIHREQPFSWSIISSEEESYQLSLGSGSM